MTPDGSQSFITVNCPPRKPLPPVCPVVMPPVCQRGYEVKKTGNVTNANGCVTPVYSCQMMPSTLFGGGGGFEFSDRMVIR